MSEHGYATTTAEEIAAEAGVQRATFHRHFDDKEACFLAAYDVLLAWLEEGVVAAVKGAGDYPTAVRAGVQAALDLIAIDPRVARLCGAEVLFAGPLARRRHRITVARLATALAVGRARCAWGTGLPRDLESTMVGGVISMLAQKAVAGSGERLLALVPEVTSFLLVPYFDVPETLQLLDLSAADPREQAAAGGS